MHFEDEFYPKDLSCPTCGTNKINVQVSTGNWACNNETCEYFHGARALFEKNYVKFKKDN